MCVQVNIFHTLILDSYGPDMNPVGPITVRHRFKQSVSWDGVLTHRSNQTIFSAFNFVYANKLQRYDQVVY